MADYKNSDNLDCRLNTPDYQKGQKIEVSQ